MKKGIIFDLDGTLWDASSQVISAYNEILNECEDIDYQMTKEKMQGFRGKRIEEIAKLLFTNVSEERGIEIIQTCCRNEQKYLRMYGGILYPNLENILQQLSKKYELYIVSNCQDGYIESFLEYHQLHQYFNDYECAGRTKKPKGENIKLVIQRNQLEKAIYVGDTAGDEEGAKVAGIPFVHASYGFGTVQEPDAILNHISELNVIAEKLL